MEQVATLKWITPDAEKEMVNIARVTNLNPPENTPAGDARLLNYMTAHGHVSPFEMASMCIEIFAPRDISRQILRHRSFSFQEFSYRYSILQEGMVAEREVRLKHPTNRQMSIDVNSENSAIKNYWETTAKSAVNNVLNVYKTLADTNEAAPETIRAILPEGFTMSHLYMTGTVRSWIFYLKERTNINTVQREHYLLVKQIEAIFKEQMPIVWEAFFGKTFEDNEIKKARELLESHGYEVFSPDKCETCDSVTNPFLPSEPSLQEHFDEPVIYKDFEIDLPRGKGVVSFLKKLIS